MKYLVLLCDGMADYPIESLGGKTPLAFAATPNFDTLAKTAEIGLVKTVPSHLKPGSDVANLSVMGYNPDMYYTGRSPLEAASIGVPMNDTDTAFRTNLVCLSEDTPYDQKTMVDYSSDEISTEEAAILINDVGAMLKTEEIKFFPGISYRHLMLWHKSLPEFTLTPPHDISGKVITEYLPGDETVYNIMKKSYELLKEHPVNKKRIEKGLRPANSFWVWGQGKKPLLSSFSDKYGLYGSVISAVDLIKGIGKLSGMDSIDVPGATGNIHTNFEGKADACINEFKKGKDFVYLHFEAPDESGHRFELDNKIASIEKIDSIVLSKICAYFKESGEEFSILILPDHPTPIATGTHSGEPVPYLLYRSNKDANAGGFSYTEEDALKSGNYIEIGHTLMDRFLKD